MPRAYIEPKYKYSGEVATIALPGSSNPNDAEHNPTAVWREGLIELANDNICFFPTIALPDRGNKHDERNGNRITVNTIRWKLNVRLLPRFLPQYGCPFFNKQENIDYSPIDPLLVSPSTVPQAGNEFSASQQRWFKFRLLAVQFEDGLQMDKKQFYMWFYSTFCPISTDMGFEGATPERPCLIVNRPISVHSNVLRMTTAWTGKFNILMDRCFTVYSTRPAVSFDLTIPLNKQYRFEETVTPDSPLLSPNIWLALMPPQSMLTDIDPLSSVQYDYCRTTQVNIHGVGAVRLADPSVPLVQLFSWSKLSYTDL